MIPGILTMRTRRASRDSLTSFTVEDATESLSPETPDSRMMISHGAIAKTSKMNIRRK